MILTVRRPVLLGLAASLLLIACSRDADQADTDRQLNAAAASLDANSAAPPDNGTAP